MGFWIQYKALMFKNWVLWKRKLLGSLCELLLPILTMFFIGLIRLANLPSHKPQQSIVTQQSKSFPVYPSAPLSGVQLSGDPPFSNCLFNNGQGVMRYTIISSDSAFINYMKSGINTVSGGAMPPSQYTYFASKTDFENYVTGSTYEDGGKYCFAVYFDENANSNYDLMLRYNITEPNPTGRRRFGDFIDIFNLESNSAYDDLIVQPTNYLAQFYSWGFLSLMNLVDNYLVSQVDPNGFVEVNFYPMRWNPYLDDSFLPVVGGMLVFFLIITFLIPICRFLAALVNDKDNRTKEMMMMMGMHSSAYWLSWITHYFIIYTIISIVDTIIVSSMSVYTYSNRGLIFLYFWLFSFSCIAFSIFLSVFFSKARSAVLVGVPIFLGSYFVSFAVSDPLTDMTKKTGASLLPCVAFSLGTTLMTELETGQQGMQTSNSGYTVGNFNHGTYFGMIIVDIIYLSVFAMYLETVWPTEWGVKRPWYFLCTSEFWCSRKHKVDQENLLKKEVNWGNAVEQVDPSIESQKASGKAMIVRGLGKHFSNKVAVEELNLDIYEGQIFALLGHNGAGKTTTLSMLTGLIPPSMGEMTIQGNLLSKNLNTIREKLGVCPQQNIIYPDLTPLEHMELFCKFKGITDPDRITKMSEEKLAELELTPKKNMQAKFLSGGQKRKLQLLLALIGDSPIVMLDEPTSGMDLTARRHVWDMLKNNKNGRIIILTTHYMEEADVLADRIAIMSQGKLRCCGSSLFLKSRYGVGYYLVLVRSQEAVKNTDSIVKFVESHVDGSRLMSESHGELTFQLPSSSASQFPQFFERIDKHFTEFGLLSYSMSATTLEEVFLRVARGDDELQNLENNREGDEKVPLVGDSEFVLEKDKHIGSLIMKHSKALLKKRALITLRDKKTLLFEIFIPICVVIAGLGLMMIPSVFKDYSPYALVLSNYSPGQDILYGGNSEGFGFVTGIPGINAKNSGIVNDATSFSSVNSSLSEFSNLVLGNITLEPELVFSYYFDQIDTSTHFYNYTVFTDEKAFQSYPTGYSMLSNQILKSLTNSNFNLTVYNYPLPITKGMKTALGSGSGFLGSLIFSLGFSFIPTGIVLFITKEREVNVKHQHMISGVSLTAYWLINFLWDFTKHIFPGVICSLMILAFNIDIYTANSTDYGGMWVMMLLGGIGQAPFSYMFSFFFKEHSSAQITMLILSFLTGSIFPSAVLVMYFFSSTLQAGKALSWILKIFPNFCFGWGVLNIGGKDIIASSLGRKDSYGAFDIQGAGGCMLLLGIMTVVYFLIVIFFELFETHPALARCINLRKAPIEEAYEHDDDVDRETEIANNTNPKEVQVNVKQLCKSFKAQGMLLTAVNKVSFNVHPEECFALLGVNGAGKTTVFKMLTGEIFSDRGEAFVGGFNVSKQLPKVRNLIGYCPQFDAISELLTGEEHLELYANIKGIPKSRVQDQVDFILKNMDLEQYRDVLAGTYSGGNKRKLSVAMALIGNPSVVFLDEPSAGMDPEARKKMWKILGNMKKQKSAVILTTHSMEEAEALCDRMTIMVRGRLKCIGSSTWIKNKFGDGYEVEIKVEAPSEAHVTSFAHNFDTIPNSHMGISFNTLPQALQAINFQYLQPMIQSIGPGAGIYNTLIHEGYISKEAFASWCMIENLGKIIENWLANEFKNVEIIEHYHLMYKFRIFKESVSSIGQLFSAIERRKVEMMISDYAICMPSLEQIFNRFAKKAEMEELQILNQQLR